MMRRPTLAFAVLFLFPQVTQADVLWNWSWTGSNGTESGTFITDGTYVGDPQAAGTYTILDFELLASGNAQPLGSVSGGEYRVGQAEQGPSGFIWDGSEATQWWRAGGIYTNGTNISQFDYSGSYLFFPGVYRLSGGDEEQLDTSSSLTMSAVGEPQGNGPAVPEPSSIALLLMGGVGLVGYGWRKRRQV